MSYKTGSFLSYYIIAYSVLQELQKFYFPRNRAFGGFFIIKDIWSMIFFHDP